MSCQTNGQTLKSCPFCGGKAEIHNCCELENETAAVVYSGKVGVHCTSCHIATMPCEDETAAANLWNRRTENV